jgi:peptidoglycan/xylan/chitin deacetylase (PgdA/CDA1 family)
VIVSDIGTQRSRIATLCFHGVGRPDRVLEPGEERFWLTRGQFSNIMDAIGELPYQVELTFDDGNESDVTHVLPTLSSLNLSAEFFIIAGRLDTRGSLSTDGLDALHGGGMRVGTHGMTHRSWRELRTQAEFEFELSESARVLESVTGIPVRHAACPRGQYDRRVLTELRHRGYTRVYTVDEGTSRPTAQLRTRYTVIHTDTAESVLARLDAPDPALIERARQGVREAVKKWR